MLSDNCAYPDNTSSPYVAAETGINFGKTSSDTNGKGLYYTSDLTRTEDTNGDGIGERVYYYRGAVDNNYIVFGEHKSDVIKYIGYKTETKVSYATYDTIEECNNKNGFNYECSRQVLAAMGDKICWKIVRTNEDGSVKLRYQGKTTNSNGKFTCSTDATPVTSMPFNALSDDIAYSGYMYPDVPTTSSILEMNNDTLNKNESDIKEFLDNWYEENLATYENNIADTIYCNDRTIAKGDNYVGRSNSKKPFGKNIVFLGSIERVVDENANTWMPKVDANPQSNVKGWKIVLQKVNQLEMEN